MWKYLLIFAAAFALPCAGVAQAPLRSVAAPMRGVAAPDFGADSMKLAGEPRLDRERFAPSKPLIGAAVGAVLATAFLAVAGADGPGSWDFTEYRVVLGAAASGAVMGFALDDDPAPR